MSREKGFEFGSPIIKKDRDAVIFPVKYDMVIYKCVVSGEVLKDYYNSIQGNYLESYENNKDQIHEVAKNLIISGEIVIVPGKSVDEVHITRSSVSRFRHR